ncbi:MAG: cyclic dehypoxanthinyl futalosine synthase [Acidobacteriota bacterium]
MSAARSILERAAGGERIAAAEGALLLREGDLLEIGEAAHAVRCRVNPGRRVSYIIERNINYTNVCITYCTFCAFYRAPGHGESYVLTDEALHRKVRETLDAGGTGILLQGGHHPDLPLPWYERMLGGIKERFRVHVHGFSPSELLHIAKVSGVPLPEVLRRLREAGLDSIPGGGAEILVDAVRDRIAPLKTRSQEWLDVMEEAHRQGLTTSATMMMGCGETLEDRITHLDRLRSLQDRTGGFNAFAAWTFQTENNPLGIRRRHREATAIEFLRTLAVSRIYLDNFPHFQSSWLTQGIKMGQLALRFGADDMGSVMLEENVVSSAGSCHRSDAEEMDRVIRGAGFEPFQRDNLYRPVDAAAVGASG